MCCAGLRCPVRIHGASGLIKKKHTDVCCSHVRCFLSTLFNTIAQSCYISSATIDVILYSVIEMDESIWMKQPTENNNFFYSINLIDNLIYDGNGIKTITICALNQTMIILC